VNLQVQSLHCQTEKVFSLTVKSFADKAFVILLLLQTGHLVYVITSVMRRQRK
jgi:hypothetical protein